MASGNHEEKNPVTIIILWVGVRVYVCSQDTPHACARVRARAHQSANMNDNSIGVLTFDVWPIRNKSDGVVKLHSR